MTKRLHAYARLLAATALASTILGGCAASSKTFYASPSRVGDTTLCRTILEAVNKGDDKFANDTVAEARRRGLTAETCQNKITTEDVAIGVIAVTAGVIAVGMACQNGCGGGGYSAPSYGGASFVDYDCAGGGGNGPRYVQGPFSLSGPDVYDLDRDGDGIGCEIGEGGFGT